MIESHFEALGRDIDTQWSKYNYDNKAFPDVAVEMLSRAGTCTRIAAEDIFRWAVSSRCLPRQVNVNTDFGQPPITLYTHPKFYIEALNWADGAPGIHQHSFSGAFGVLEGSSLQCLYEFRHQVRVNAHMSIGQLTLTEASVLERGHIEPIHSGPRLIHSTFHLDSPSVTLVVRTYSDVECQPQMSYLRPSLAVDSGFVDATAVRRAQLLTLLDATRDDLFDEMATLALTGSDLFVVFELLKTIKRTRAGAARFAHWVDLARSVHGASVDRLCAAIDEFERGRVIASKRARVRPPHHRFLLALLLTIDSRDRILSMVKQRFPADDPKALVSRWAFELSGSDVSGIEFNDGNRVLFTHLMEGLPVNDIVEQITKRYTLTDVTRDRLTDHLILMRQSPIFAPLLQQASTVAA